MNVNALLEEVKKALLDGNPTEIERTVGRILEKAYASGTINGLTLAIRMCDKEKKRHRGPGAASVMHEYASGRMYEQAKSLSHRLRKLACDIELEALDESAVQD